MFDISPKTDHRIPHLYKTKTVSKKFAPMDASQSCLCQPVFTHFASKSVIFVVCFLIPSQTHTPHRGYGICLANFTST